MHISDKHLSWSTRIEGMAQVVSSQYCQLAVDTFPLLANVMKSKMQHCVSLNCAELWLLLCPQNVLNLEPVMWLSITHLCLPYLYDLQNQTCQKHYLPGHWTEIWDCYWVWCTAAGFSKLAQQSSRAGRSTETRRLSEQLQGLVYVVWSCLRLCVSW